MSSTANLHDKSDPAATRPCWDSLGRLAWWLRASYYASLAGWLGLLVFTGIITFRWWKNAVMATPPSPAA